jgi:2,3-bisphosphoglycerate-dependent phosphoglycerate mutase
MTNAATVLLIARHGNTFDPGETVRRVGGRTDLPLSASGRLQAEKLGHYLYTHGLQPAGLYTSTLARTQHTAALAMQAAGWALDSQALALFDEVDYGVDENQPESAVLERLGAAALAAWEAEAIVPPGWCVDPAAIIKHWHNFAETLRMTQNGQTSLVVTSNGVARFAPHITGDWAGFCAQHQPKMATGALSILRHTPAAGWQIAAWNIRP